MKNRIGLLLFVTFIESLATICVERGIYFLTNSAASLKFSAHLNLYLALAFGVAYFAGAILSHPLCNRLREKRILLACLWAQAIAHIALAIWWKRPDFIFTGNIAIGFINGLKWPVLESYISAGLRPARIAKVIGWFNISWAGSVPLALLVAGPIIDSNRPELLFLLPLALNLLSLALCLQLEVRPVHLPVDHPHRPSQTVLSFLRSRLLGSRWLLLASYSAMWVLAALMPDVFKRLGYSSSSATGLSSTMDVVRWFCFVGLQFYRGWQYRISYLIAALMAIPAGLFMVLYGPDLATVLVGEVIFGFSAGLVYYSALYYAMVVKNASVEAGGVHEGLIGMGFAIGPAAGLFGSLLSGWLGSPILGMTLGLGPMLAVCFAGAIWSLIRGGPKPARQEMEQLAAETAEQPSGE